jgi:hypothetical protein
MIQETVHQENESIAHALAADEFVNVMYNLPSRSFLLMSALADGQLNDGHVSLREGQVDECVGNHQAEEGHTAGGIACDTDESSNISIDSGSS